MVFGPGLLVCLADTDAGCLIVAAQSGARWGYSLLLLQVLLIPVLFCAQELTIRLGVHTRQGHTACIKEHFGAFWAWFACSFLVIECVGAMVSEMSGIAAVAELWGFGRIFSTAISSAIIVSIVVFGNYKQIETIGVALGLFELVFVFTMVCCRPPISKVLKESFSFPSDSEYFSLIAANIGAVIMPWMIYFQQSAVVARRLRVADLQQERKQTMLGSVLTQLVMIGMLVTLASAHKQGADIETVTDIVNAISPLLGATWAKLFVTLGFTGGSLCAAFVVSLAASWAVCEALGVDDHFSLDRPPAKAPAFYTCFLAVVLVGAAVLLGGVNIVKLNIFVELMDGLLMPMAVGFLLLLAQSDALPEPVRIKGYHKWLLWVLFGSCSILSVGSALYALIRS
jgi:Mn2+/Fe2+ NRAMP family transporter